MSEFPPMFASQSGHTTHFDDCGCKSKALEAERDALRLRVAALQAALLSVQWGGRIGQEGEYRACPSCESIAPDDPDFGGGDHLPGCALNSALTGDTTALRAMLVPAFNAGFNARDNGEGMNGYEDGDDYADRILGASKEGGE